MLTQAATPRRSFNLILLMLLFSLLSEPALSQGIKADTRFISQHGTHIRVNGSIEIQQEAHFEGTLVLTGDLIDDYGLEIYEGRVKFEGTGHDQLLSGSALSIFNELEIGSQASLQITTGKRVTVNGELLNNNETGALHLKSGINTTASLIHANQSIYASMQNHLHAGQFNMLSSPVAYQGFEPGFYASGDFLYAWYEPYSSYIEYSNNIFHPTFLFVNHGADYFLPATGYFAYYPSGVDGVVHKEFSGDLNQGEISFILSSAANPEGSQHNNLLGNPYASAIDWNAAEGWSGKEHLAGGPSKDDKPAWIWNEVFQNFGIAHPRTHSGTHNGISGYIPPMTGFWVQAAQGADGEMLTMDDRVRVHIPPLDEKQQPDDLQGIIRLGIGLEDKSWRDEVLIEYHHNGEVPGVGKMFSINPGAPQLYVVHDEQNYSLLFLNDPEEYREILLEHDVPVNSTFYLDTHIADDLPVQLILEDRHTNRQHVLTGQDAISLQAPSSRADGRFVLTILPVEGR